MRKITFAILAVAALAADSYGVGLGFGGYYLLGMPTGELTASEFAYLGQRVPIDMDSGIPFKLGPANFGLGAVVNFTPRFGVEGGLEMHTGYKNKEAEVSGNVMGEPFRWTEPEDNITWTMTNIYLGARVTFPTGTLAEPFGGGGLLLLSNNKFEPESGYGEGEISFESTAMGAYFGGGVNLFVTRKVAITVPVKYALIFGSSYTYYADGTEIAGYSENWTPPAYLAVGGGVTFYPL